MNKFEKFFFNHRKKLEVFKWHHYLEIYDRHFKKFQGKNPVILEIGVYKGGSLDMWNHYFDGQCTIYGVDIDPSCKDIPNILQSDNIKICIGSQDDKVFWEAFKGETPKFDIILDDGGHHMHQQIISWQSLYDHMTDDGVYMCEDTHTSYWAEYSGGLKRPNTFVEFSKDWVDELNAYHQRDPSKDLSFRQKTHSLHYYDSIVVLERRKDTEPPLCSRQT